MSEENVEIVRAILEAWNRGDAQAVVERVNPEIVAEAKLDSVVDGRYEGLAAVQKWLVDFWGNFGVFHTDFTDLDVAGNEVVVHAHQWGRGKASGVDVEMENWQVFTVRDGRVIHYRLFKTRREALEAAGLRE